MTTLKFSIAAIPPRTITRVKQGDLPDDEIDFCSDTGPRTVVTGRGLALGAGDTVKLELRPNKGEPIAVLDQLRDIQSSETQISFLSYLNSSSHLDGDWRGENVLLTVTIGGKPVTRWLKFHDWS